MIEDSQTVLPTIAIVGAGKVGVSLAQSFRRNGYPVTLASRTPKKTAQRLKLTELIINTSEQAVKNADITLLAVTDQAVESVCNSLTSHYKPGSIVAHCSGAMDSQALSVATRQGCLTCSVHPLNTFPNLPAAMRLMANNAHNTYLYSEGDKKALQIILPHFKILGFHPVEISTQAKPLYHAACVFACNYLTTLMDISLQTAEAADLDRGVFWQAVQPLIQATLTNISQDGTAAALSGPIARGDHTTVKTHLSELDAVSDEVRNMYATMAIQTVKLAAQNNQLDAKTIDQLMALLKSD